MNKEMKKPPFTISMYMLQKAMSISDKIRQLSAFASLERMPILRKNNKIQSVHSSLFIEANSLSLGQVRDVINGKLVLGPQREIQEVKNAYEAYERIGDFNAYSQDDLKKAHSILTRFLSDESGKYRNHGEGVYSGNTLVFLAPPEDMVPKLMDDLFSWLKEDNETPTLIKSCIFHYEFVFIHPFGDGNGRTARLWQNVLLMMWDETFEYVPIETQIAKYQQEYYRAIANCHKNGNSNEFIEFMLRMIDETLDSLLLSVRGESLSISDAVNKLLSVLEYDTPLSANEIMAKLGIKSKETLRSTYLGPALKNGLVRMTLPDKPNSKNQKYYK